MAATHHAALSAPTMSAACCARRELLDAREARKRNEITAAGAARGSRTRRSATSVKLQEDLGLKSVTDGEFRRTFWHLDFLEQFDERHGGRRRASRRASTRTRATSSSRRRASASTASSRGRSGIFVEHFKFLKSVTHSDAEADDPVAQQHAFPRRARRDRRRRPIPTWASSTPISRRVYQRGDRRIWPPPAAAICRSTR